MAKIKKNELKKMPNVELDKKLLELQSELMLLRGQIATRAPLKSPGMVNAIKKNIARIHTYKKQKEVVKTK